MQGVKLTPSEINEILMLRLKYPDWSLRQISRHTRRHGKHTGFSHQTIKRTLDTYPDIATLKQGARVQLSCEVEVFPEHVGTGDHKLKVGEEVQIIAFTPEALLVSAYRYPNIAIDIPPTAVCKK